MTLDVVDIQGLWVKARILHDQIRTCRAAAPMPGFRNGVPGLAWLLRLVGGTGVFRGPQIQRSMPEAA